MTSVLGRIPTIPEYYRDMIDKNVDLTENKKQCCPFHNEATPSFSYSPDKGKWRCFGACHTGGDVIDLHKMNYKLKSREEAKRSLYALYHVSIEKEIINPRKGIEVNEGLIRENTAIVKACMLADCRERWLELDYLMSATPVETLDLQEMVNKWEAERAQ